MLQFQPSGFVQRVLSTPLGVLAYYTHPPSAAGEDNRPPLVFLHSLGGGSSAFEWSRVYAAFGQSHRVIAPDLIGWGQSAHPVRNYRVDDYFQVITHLIEALAEPPALVIATSLTAGVVIRLATQRPDLFQRLFLVSPAGNGDFGQDYRASLPALLASTPGVDTLLYRLGAANEWAVRGFLSTFLFANPSRITEAMVQAYLTCTQQPNAQYAALASLNGTLSFDLSRYIGQLTVPTHILLGEKSRFTPPAISRRLASLNPQAVKAVIEIPDAGVLPHLERPEAVTAYLQDHL